MKRLVLPLLLFLAPLTTGCQEPTEPEPAPTSVDIQATIDAAFQATVEAQEPTSTPMPTPTPTPERRADYIEFGTGEDPASDTLGLVGISDTFDEDAEVWVRVRLSKSAGRPRVDFLLERRAEGAVGWTSVETWASTGDPDANIFRIPATGYSGPFTWRL